MVEVLHNQLAGTAPEVFDTNLLPEQARFLDDFNESVIWEDPHMMVLNKPAGITSQGDKTNFDATMAARMMRSSEVSPVHRLDKLTSGILVFAKTRRARRFLSNQFRKETAVGLEKGYLAVCNAGFGQDRYIETFIDDSQTPVTVTPEAGRKSSRTVITKIADLRTEEGEERDLLAIQTLSGRTHQIRAVLASLGQPILCDPLYGGYGTYGPMRLHAHYLRIPEVESKELLQLVAPVPDYFFLGLGSKEKIYAAQAVTELQSASLY